MRYTSEQATAEHRKLYDEALELLASKRVDYAPGNDPFANFRNSLLIDVEPWEGAWIRLLDKMVRFKNLMQKGGTGAVNSESLRDTALDIPNYSGIMYQLAMECLSDAQDVADLGEREKVSLPPMTRFIWQGIVYYQVHDSLFVTSDGWNTTHSREEMETIIGQRNKNESVLGKEPK